MITRLTKTRSVITMVMAAAVLAPCVACAIERFSSERSEARRILDATGVEGGLVVHIGCGDGRLTAALRANDRYVVHGLDTDGAEVDKARDRIRAAGLYGKVSVDKLRDSMLPYTDNLVNLVVSEDLGKVSMDEVMRVLCPNGVAYIKKGPDWAKTVKPRPDEIDEWTHYLHDATGNAVAHDTVVGPPRHLQWVGSPRWSRHHDRMASMTAMVSAGGRIFYIFDEGPTSSILLPAKPVLIARDAFNGTILWKRPIASWLTHIWPFKSGPAQLPRRLVAVGDTVYVTLGFEAPLTALDAATGETVRTYKDSKATEEVIASDGVLFLLVNENPSTYNKYGPAHRAIGQAKKRVATEWPWDEANRSIMAVRADTGKVLWSSEQRVVPLTLAADGNRVFFHDGEKVVCLNRNNGDEVWRSSPVARQSSIPTCFGPTLVVYQDVVLFSGGTRSMTALSVKTGETLWSSDKARSGHNCPEDVLVAGGLLWAGATASSRDSGVFTGWDPVTGEVKSEFPPDVETYWFHQRCYRSKATDRYLLPSRTGIEFVDFRSNHWIPHHWVRGGCLYGIMPCNGLIYTPPHSCACYIDSKLNGFYALAPESTTRQTRQAVSDTARLERGPAFGKVTITHSALRTPQSDDWPTYRHDPARSGRTKAAVPTDLKRAWRTDLGGKLSSVVVAGDRVFVVAVDAHTVYALDAGSGKTLWSYTAGGRVDSPPTIYQGRVLFGSADGWVYCLRASDGELVWRFRAAPQDLRLISFEQLESVWPVHGSVLIEDGVVYCVAGRSMFLNGGMRFLRLDPKTGRKISETILDDRDPETGENLQEKIQRLSMPTALPDILSSDGKYVYMRTQQFNLDGVRTQVAVIEAEQQGGEGSHLFSGIGFLDGSWFHRGYWEFGRGMTSGPNGYWQAGRYAPAGRILTFDESSVYGYGRKPEYYRWTTPIEYHLFAVSKEPDIVEIAVDEPPERMIERSRPPSTRLAYHWSEASPLHVRAMVLADTTLFIAGPPDVVDEEQAFDSFNDAATQAKLGEQSAAIEGQSGALLWAVSASDGKKLAEYNLQSPPVWDGMAAANGRLYMSTTDGKVLCMSGSGNYARALK